VELVPQTTHHKYSKQVLKLLVGVIAAFVIGIGWQSTIQTQLSSLLDPPSANAYCSGVLLCGNYHNVCGTCPNGGGACAEGGRCPDFSLCPCGDQCFPSGGGGGWVTCSGGSQAACMGTSCGGGTCRTPDTNCSWSAFAPTPLPPGSPTAPPGSTECGNCGTNCGTHGENSGVCTFQTPLALLDQIC
jgi:hypothetical protein